MPVMGVWFRVVARPERAATPGIVLIIVIGPSSISIAPPPVIDFSPVRLKLGIAEPLGHHWNWF
jgi:hypothetical protein